MHFVDERARNITSKCCTKSFDNIEENSEYYEEDQISFLPQKYETKPILIALDETEEPEVVQQASTKQETNAPLNCASFDFCEKSQHCAETPDGYECLCNSGYEILNSECIDINECTKSWNNCTLSHKKCVNTEGSFRCGECLSGYEKSETYDDDYDFSCTEIDQCKRNVCGKKEICSNIAGSYRCTKFVCPENYEYHNKT